MKFNICVGAFAEWAIAHAVSHWETPKQHQNMSMVQLHKKIDAKIKFGQIATISLG